MKRYSGVFQGEVVPKVGIQAFLRAMPIRSGRAVIESTFLGTFPSIVVASQDLSCKNCSGCGFGKLKVDSIIDRMTSMSLCFRPCNVNAGPGDLELIATAEVHRRVYPVRFISWNQNSPLKLGQILDLFVVERGSESEEHLLRAFAT